METVIHAMMNLIANEVCGKQIDRSQYVFSDEELILLHKLSKAHDLAHIVGDALIKNDLINNDEVKSKFQKQIMLAAYRYEKINYELECLCKVLNEAEIPFIPLKGSVIRQYYPEPWMRTSCDIDILVHEEQVDQAAQRVVDTLGYTYKKKNYHDISLMSGGGVHLELHFSIKENQKNIDALLTKCWDYAISHRNYEYKFSNEFFLFHQLAHASYHFLNGGCGIRPILDVYLLEKKLAFDRGILNDMLMKTGIKTFFEALTRLSDAWFADGAYDDGICRMEKFVLSEGVYGNDKNSIVISQQSEKGRLGYIFHRIWMPYESLCLLYPKLCGRRYLQPFYEVKRWLKIFKPEVRKRKSCDLDIIKNLSAETKREVNCMLHELGLM